MVVKQLKTVLHHIIQSVVRRLKISCPKISLQNQLNIYFMTSRQYRLAQKCHPQPIPKSCYGILKILYLVESYIIYVGMTLLNILVCSLIINYMNWTKHCRHAVKKATRSLNCLYFSMYGCSCMAKCAAYKAIVCPLLELLLLCVVHTLKETLIYLNHFKMGLLGGYVVVAGAPKPLFLHRIAALNLTSLLSKPCRQQFLSISFLHDIYHHHTSINFDHHFKFNSVLYTRSHHLSLCHKTKHNNKIQK